MSCPQASPSQQTPRGVLYVLYTYMHIYATPGFLCCPKKAPAQPIPIPCALILGTAPVGGLAPPIPVHPIGLRPHPGGVWGGWDQPARSSVTPVSPVPPMRTLLPRGGVSPTAGVGVQCRGGSPYECIYRCIWGGHQQVLQLLTPPSLVNVLGLGALGREAQFCLGAGERRGVR